jgi:hypothetical protein
VHHLGHYRMYRYWKADWLGRRRAPWWPWKMRILF